MTEARPADARLADGAWHRLHPATPLLRGGFAFIAILGIVISNLRERLLGLVVGSVGGPSSGEGDPVDLIVRNGFVPLVLAAIAVVLLLFVGLFYVAWRVREFRITDELVEVRSGVLYRTNRKGRLDRIQGVNIVRPLFARLFGAARLEIDVAGNDANVRLDYLSSAKADGLRLDILRLASGTRQREASAAATARAEAAPGEPAPSILDQRIAEFTAPEFDPSRAAADSVVKLHLGRLLGSLILHDTTVIFLLIIVGAGAISVASGEPLALFFLLPFLFGLGSVILRRFTKSLRYSIAATPDGVRVGFGVLTLSNETLPPGRIHSIQVRQPILWRLPGWWEIRVNRASKSHAKGADGQRNTTILPVGNLDDVMRVLDLLLPGLVSESTAAVLRRGIVGSGAAGGFTNSPPRARLIRWFSRRRNGFGFVPGVILLRTGAIWRKLTVVPEPRVQSIALTQGPFARMLGLARIHVHTVLGPIRAEVGAIDRDNALTFFQQVTQQVVQSVNSDATHRWRSGEALAGSDAAQGAS